MKRGLRGTTLLTIGVETGCNSFSPDGGFVVSGKSYNQDGVPRFMLSQFAGNGKSIYLRHDDVQNGDLRYPCTHDADDGVSALYELNVESCNG